MQVDEPTNPPPGPPKKGFWGFIAGMFPKQPKIEPKNEPEKPFTGGEPEKPEDQSVNANDPSNETVAAPDTSSPEAKQPFESAEPSAPASETVPPVSAHPDPESDIESPAGQADNVSTVNQTGLPQAQEEGGAHDEAEAGTPPTVAVPPSVKLPGLEENENNPPTLPVEPPAIGDSSDEDSTTESDEDGEQSPFGTPRS